MDGKHTDIAVIGAGMAGLACATRLSEAGHSVAVFDKGRGPGGRMAARRAQIAGATVSFDHGAQYFTARDPAFRAQVEAWVQQGAAARWPTASRADDDPAFVGTPGMNGPIRSMANALAESGGTVTWGTRIDSLARHDAHWRIAGEGVDCTSDLLCVAIPAEQAHVLLQDAAPRLASVAGSGVSEPCWAVMAGFASALEIKADTMRDRQSPVSWAARNSSKPARTGSECWVIHASPARSREIVDHPKDEAATLLIADFFAQAGISPVAPVHLDAHRWLYAMPTSVKGEAARFDSDEQIGIAGDYLTSPRVEGAWLSGTALAHRVLEGFPR